MTLTVEQRATGGKVRLAVIDCDIHNSPPSEGALLKYFPERWRDYHAEYGPRFYSGAYYPLANQNAARTDSWPPSGLPPGSDLDFLREQLLDRWELEYGLMLPLYAVGGQLNLGYGTARAIAINDWQVEEWAQREPRLRGSIVVAYEDPPSAAAEIDRLGDNPTFVQVLVESRTLQPLGQRKYWPIYEAACRRGLPVAMHFGALGGWPIGSGIGAPSFYIEYHAGQLTSFQDQLISLVCEGVFERFPDLKLVLVEGGFAWLPPLMWRLDRAWKKLRSEVPHLRRLPSEYIRQNVWFTTQPVEEPPRPAEFRQLLADLGMDDRILFATDYPHWDFDSPDQAIPAWLPEETRRAIYAENARKLYRFGNSEK
jgi:predicted TIM-barrel fold metal-dependent hydrolase